jgi:UDP-GlcNAc:undecaprenyl-phosphate GlcNAc-1-phosphate transferase
MSLSSLIAALPDPLPFQEGATSRIYLLFFGMGLLVTLLATPPVRRLALRLGLIDRPQHRKVHRRATPLLGGVAVFFGMWIPILFFYLYNEDLAYAMDEKADALWLVFGAGTSMLVLGLIDDRLGLRAHQKFLGQFPVAIILVLLGVRIQMINLPWLGAIDLGLLGPIVTIVWIVGLTNALNLVDGIDGAAAGVAFYVAFTNGVLAVLNQNLVLGLVMWALAGACLGFLKYNFNPATIFLGDCGSLFLGATLAVSSIVCNAKGSTAVSLVIPVIVAGYPILDTLLAMGRRFLSGKPMFSGDASHIHHRMLARGLDQTRAAAVIYTICAVLSCTAIAYALRHVKVAMGILLLLSIGLILGLWYLGYLNYLTSSRLHVERNRYRAAYHLAEAYKAELSLALRPGDVLEILRDAARRFEMRGLKLERCGSDRHPELVELLPIRVESHDPPCGANMETTEAATVPASATGVLRDHYHFDDTGLDICLEYGAETTLDELQVERRSLLSELFKAANHRLGVLTTPPVEQ